MEWFFSFLNFDVETFLALTGSDPFSSMGYLFLHGGWILFVFVFLWIAVVYRQNYVSGKVIAKQEWILLRITVPKDSEQTARAAENMFISFAGAHSSPSWTETWVRGFKQAVISVEIASIEGRVGFYVRGERRFRDLMEGSIYAQYPHAEIQEVQDYTDGFPSHFPDEEWDCWGTEMIPTMPDPYILKTYHDFEDKVSGEFKDPIAYMLELMSRLGPGEHLWYQITLTQTDHKKMRQQAEKIIDTLKGVEKVHKKTLMDHAIDFPLKTAQEVVGTILGTPPAAPEHKKDDKALLPKLFALSPGEKDVLEGVEHKASQVGHECKIRFVYMAKKEVMKKSRAVNTFIGAMKQTNTFHMQALKPELKMVGMGSALWWFKERRNNHRKSHVVHAYKKRSDWMGMPRFFLCSEELATLWHLPILIQVKAPSLHKVEAKKAEAPDNLPFG
ncbi:hypothetical protein EXS71_00120 [Candidatus Uhrbacteria bacterium]|nr:hypothetical protein [Candidatus Uhrbacteria bacterium]